MPTTGKSRVLGFRALRSGAGAECWGVLVISSAFVGDCGLLRTAVIKSASIKQDNPVYE
jgi:hypothetical protein